MARNRVNAAVNSPLCQISNENCLYCKNQITSMMARHVDNVGHSVLVASCVNFCGKPCMGDTVY